MNPDSDPIVIIGAGIGGVSAAAALREAGVGDRIKVLEAEPVVPYDRPPLSKSVMTEGTQPADHALRPPSWYAEQRIELMSGHRAQELSTSTRRVALADGSSLQYRRLLLVTGARPRRLPHLEEGALTPHYFRGIEDAMRLRAALRPGCRILLIGGGVIGMELAASAVTLGCEVTVLEMSDRIMGRMVCMEVSKHILQHHQERGVRVLMERRPREQQTRHGSHGVVLEDDTFIVADEIVIGVGVVPDTQLAQHAGVQCDDGILVDEFGRSSDPYIFAAGDVARYPDGFLGGLTRSESWTHAQRHSATVARNMVLPPMAFSDVPYVWSDQYGLKIQVVGTPRGDRSLLRGDPSKSTFVRFHMAGKRVVGAVGINNPREMGLARRIIESGREVRESVLTDPGADLRQA